MWVKGSPLHFIVDSESQKNLILAEVVKQLGLLTTTHPQPYNIGWLHQGRYLRVNQQCCMTYGIQSFKDEVVCDLAPFDVGDVVLGQSYMWKHHVVYESRPRNVIITLGGHLYRIPEVVSTTVPPKQFRKVISHIAKFILSHQHRKKVGEGPKNIVSGKVRKSQQKIEKLRQTLKNTKYIHFFKILNI
jgi:hypothetical protein